MTTGKRGHEIAMTNIKVTVAARDALNARKRALNRRRKRNERRVTQSDAIEWMAQNCGMGGEVV